MIGHNLPSNIVRVLDNVYAFLRGMTHQGHDDMLAQMGAELERRELARAIIRLEAAIEGQRAMRGVHGYSIRHSGMLHIMAHSEADAITALLALAY
jgi:hypothetical protein